MMFLRFTLPVILILGAFMLWHGLRQAEYNRAYAGSLRGFSAFERDIASAPVLSVFEQNRLRHKLGRHPDDLLHLSAADIYAVLRAPELVRNDFPTTVWQYRNASCVLDIYLVTVEVEAMGTAPVVHYDMRARGPEPHMQADEARDCLRRFL